MQRAWGFVVSLAFLSVPCLLSCTPHARSTGPVGSTISEAEEVQIGKSADRLVRQEPGLYAAKADLAAYVASVGSKIAARSKRRPESFTFAIVDTPDLNAFACPGGFVYVTRGLLGWLNSEDELAAVLAGEVAHVAERHGVERLSRPETAIPEKTRSSPSPRPSMKEGDQAAAGSDSLGSRALVLALQGRSPREEREADELGRKYLVGAGYNTDGIESLVATLARARRISPLRFEPWLASHPATSERIARTAGGPSSVGKDGKDGASRSKEPSDATPAPRREDYLTKIEGMAAGQSNEVSWVIGDLYVNKKHDYSLRIPPGWTAGLHGADLMLTKGEIQCRAEMKVEAMARPGVSGDVARDYARSAGRAGIEIVGPVTKAGLPAGEAAIVEMRSKDETGKPISIRKMFLVRFDRVYVLTFTTPPDMEEYQTFMNLTGSIEFLTPDRIQASPPPRIALHRVQDGDTWDSIAPKTAHAKSVSGEDARAGSEQAGGSIAERLADFNGRDAKQPPTAGDLVKVPPAAVLE